MIVKVSLVRFLSFAGIHKLHAPVSVRECIIDYLIERTYYHIILCYILYYVILCHIMYTYISVFCYVFIMLIIVSISAKRHELWYTVRDMRLSKCSIIIIIIYMYVYIEKVAILFI